MALLYNKYKGISSNNRKFKDKFITYSVKSGHSFLSAVQKT